MELLAAPPAQRQLGLHWWHWRRAHQTTARRCHIARRAGQQPPGESAPVVVAVPGTPRLTESHWPQVAALLSTDGRRGRPPLDHRRILAGMLWVMHTGAAWRELPKEFGVWQTIYSRYTRWRREGTWARILAILLQPSPRPPT